MKKEIEEEFSIKLQIEMSKIKNLSPSMDEPSLLLNLNEIEYVSELTTSHQKLKDAISEMMEEFSESDKDYYRAKYGLD